MISEGSCDPEYWTAGNSALSSPELIINIRNLNKCSLGQHKKHLSKTGSVSIPQSIISDVQKTTYLVPQCFAPERLFHCRKLPPTLFHCLSA